MRMRLLLSLVFGLLIIATTAAAQEVTLTSMVRPIYLGDDGMPFAKKPVWQTDVFAEWSSGLFADVWVSTGPDTKPEFDKELDFAVGFSDTLTKFRYTVDGQYYVIHGIDVVNANVEVGAKIFFAKLQAYAPVQKGGPGNGLITSAGVNLEGLPLFERYDRVQLNVGQWLKHDTGSFDLDEAWLTQGLLGVTLKLTERVTAPLGVKWSMPLNNPSDGRKGEFIWEAGITVGIK